MGEAAYWAAVEAVEAVEAAEAAEASWAAGDVDDGWCCVDGCDGCCVPWVRVEETFVLSAVEAFSTEPKTS